MFGLCEVDCVFRTRASRSASTSTRTTCAPWASIVRAVSTPMPPAPPVMTMRLPANSDMSRHQALVIQRCHHLHAAHVAWFIRCVAADGIVHGADVVPHQY